MPQLSVIIPLYNQASFIEISLNSIARQHLPLEIIVVDDASTDDGPAKVKAWAARHPVPLQLIRQPERSYALAARLAGVAAAQASNIMFMDADDTLAGTRRLARVLARKQETSSEIAHFRSLAHTPTGEERGEILWSAPPVSDVLRGSAVFSAFAACPYPPILLWGKIYSRTLLERVTPFAQGRKIYRFDDKFLVSLLVLHAQSYVGCEEYVYRYRLCETWPMNKFAGRVHDLLALGEIIEPLLDAPDVDPDAARNFRHFLKQRLTINMGRLCIEAEKRLFAGEHPDTIFAEITPFLDDEQLFTAALFSSRSNTKTVSDIWLRICDEF